MYECFYKPTFTVLFQYMYMIFIGMIRMIWIQVTSLPTSHNSCHLVISGILIISVILIIPVIQVTPVIQVIPVILVIPSKVEKNLSHLYGICEICHKWYISQEFSHENMENPERKFNCMREWNCYLTRIHVKQTMYLQQCMEELYNKHAISVSQNILSSFCFLLRPILRIQIQNTGKTTYILAWLLTFCIR